MIEFDFNICLIIDFKMKQLNFDMNFNAKQHQQVVQKPKDC